MVECPIAMFEAPLLSPHRAGRRQHRAALQPVSRAMLNLINHGERRCAHHNPNLRHVALDFAAPWCVSALQRHAQPGAARRGGRMMPQPAEAEAKAPAGLKQSISTEALQSLRSDKLRFASRMRSDTGRR
jgi:hypothetical protein